MMEEESKLSSTTTTSDRVEVVEPEAVVVDTTPAVENTSIEQSSTEP